MLDKNGIAKRIAKEVQDGFYVNLGIGIPTLVAQLYSRKCKCCFTIRKWIVRNGTFPYRR